MGAFTYIETDTGTNVDISAATAVGAYTSTGDKLIMVDVSIDAVAGNGDYVMYVTRQIGGSGSAYVILPKTTMTAASGETAISAQSGWITVRNGDVLTCYVDGLAGDTTTPDWTTRWFELAGVTAAAVADAVWDEATADHTTATSFGALDANVDAILADTGTDGVKIASAQTVATVTNLTNLPSIPANWITAAGIATGAIDADAIADGAIDAGAIASNAIAAAKIATGAITSAKFAAGAIDAAAIATDAIGSAEISAAAVTKIQSGLALEATLTAIKGAGWTNQTLVSIIDYLTTTGVLVDAQASGMALESTLAAIMGAGWTNQTLVKIVTDIAAISAGSGATAQEVWEYATRVLTAGTNIDLSALATATDLATVDTVVDAIKAKTDNLPLSPASSGEYTSALTAIQADLDNPNQYKANVSGLATTAHVQEVENKIDAIDVTVNTIPTNPLLDTDYTAPDNTGIAAIQSKTDQLTFTTPNKVDTNVTNFTNLSSAIWANPSRSLTVSSVRPRTLVDGDQYTIYKDTSIAIPFTGLGDISGYTNLWFTIKREQDLESADTQSIVHMDYLTGLLYINKAVATAGHGAIVLDDLALGNIRATITKDGGALLPVFAKEPLRWEVKGIAGSVVDILLQGTCYIQPAVSRKIA